MSNDLEEFLRQAAAIRQRKSIEQRAAAAQQEREQQSRSRPQYTNARQERLVDAGRAEDDDEEEQTVLGIEILPDNPAPNSRAQAGQAIQAGQHNQAVQSNQAEQSGKAESLRRRTERAKRDALSSAKTDARQTDIASDLRKMLARPDGIRQAFLVREIFNRPRF